MSLLGASDLGGVSHIVLGILSKRKAVGYLYTVTVRLGRARARVRALNEIHRRCNHREM